MFARPVPRLSRRVFGALLFFLMGVPHPRASAQIEFDREPIEYSSRPVDGPVARLQRRIDAGEVTLEFDEEHGYLKAVLDALDISPQSQMLVFSKTSFQLRKISPRTPRALYFNDNTYVGWVPRGDVIEVTSVDPQQGAVFYTLNQEDSDKPRFVRDQGNCMTCHASSRTFGIPGHLVRSVYPSASGQPHFGSGTFRTNHASPLSERWGGWYVTGTHGNQRHMGNVIAHERDRPEELDVESGANVTCLEDLTSIDRYLTPHSDIVALMVLEHQTDMANLITRASYETRIALHYGSVMNEALDRPADFVSDSTQRRIASAAEDLVEYMLFAEEVPLSDPIRGTSDFADEFVQQGTLDARGRSLRELDLETRMFKYPCSYMIYSDAFAALPVEAKQVIFKRLHEVLTGVDESEKYANLSAADRQAIYEILLETLPEARAYWEASK